MPILAPEVPASVVLLEITAVFAHEDTKEGVMVVYRLPRRNDYFGLEGRFGGEREFDGGIDYAHERIESVEFDVGLGGNFRCAACCEQACERYFKNEFHSCLAAKVLKKAEFQTIPVKNSRSGGIVRCGRFLCWRSCVPGYKDFFR